MPLDGGLGNILTGVVAIRWMGRLELLRLETTNYNYFCYLGSTGGSTGGNSGGGKEKCIVLS